MVIGELRDTRVMARAMANIQVSNNLGSGPFYNFKLLEYQGSLRNQNTFLLPALLHTYEANKSRFFLFFYSPSAVPYYCTLVLFVPLYELVCSSFGKNTIFLPVFEEFLA